MKKYIVALNFKGLTAGIRTIGTFALSQTTINKLERNYSNDFTLNIYCDTNEKATRYSQVIDTIREKAVEIGLIKPIEAYEIKQGTVNHIQSI